MTTSTRAELFDALAASIREGVLLANPAYQPLEVEVFFADELLFATASHRDGESVLWRSSHAATPDSTAIPALKEAGADLVARIVADANLAGAVDRGVDD